MMSLASFGNALYSGDKSFGFIPNRRRWITIGLTIVVIAIALLGLRGLNPSIEFAGGSQFTLTGVADTNQAKADEIMRAHGYREGVKISKLGSGNLRVQASQMDTEESTEISKELAKAYGVDEANADATNIGPTWGHDVTMKALQSLVIFLVLVGILMAGYFRSFAMSVSALFALMHDLFVVTGFFALTQVEVSPATVIGFLTILAYSLYDTVVVFDRVRELTANLSAQRRYTYGELVNLAVNQTLVRSINTSVVAILPVGAILFLGSVLLGAGTLMDISLAIFVGTISGALSSIFIAPSMLVVLRNRNKDIAKHTEAVQHQRQADRGTGDGKGTSQTRGEGDNAPEEVVAHPVRAGRHLGQSAQPKRKKRKKK
ncbi:protein translocase subunit SecF [Gleimia hominis]|uniref:Protein-export membrane protein SecF n=1 Tax=Gleimia hominis TaxID=595468 RepID=A0ABU3IBE0_9ACTO|nr:protein translocase subunit SecF [Gleimia hominis]MDT3767697.1 protein translocase subunit SecF [Gleimia hominis]